MTTDDRTQLPMPGWSPLTEGYWRAAHDGRLVVPRCTACGAHRWPPAWACYRCQSRAWEWSEVPGTGTVFTYTWADVRPVADSPLYNITVVELDGTEGEPVRVMSQVVGVDKDALSCDLRVEATFEPFDDEVSVPVFRPCPAP
jgi:uncharacterized OB-fold protein